MIQSNFLEYETTPGAIATCNHTGFMFTELSYVSQEYIKFTKSCKNVLDIGCAYGVSVLPVLEHKNPVVYAIDLSQEHLDRLWNLVDVDQKKYLITKAASFPEEINFPNNFCEAIHLSNVLHFFTGNQIEIVLNKCFKWLSKNGKLFINTCSLYLPYLNSFISTYESRKNEKCLWPGEIENHRDFLPESFEQKNKEPAAPFLHIFKKEDLEQVIKKSGFRVDKSHYFTLKNLTYIKSMDDSRAWIGLIVTKS